MATQNKLGVIINAPFFERDIRRTYQSRVNYELFLKYLSDDDYTFTNDDYTDDFRKVGTFRDVVRAMYFYPETRFNNNQFQRLDTPGRRSFLSALQHMGYDTPSAFNSVDAKLCPAAIALAQGGTVDTIVLLGLTVDHEDLVWAIRSSGVRIIGFFADTHSLSERLKQGLHHYYRITPEMGFLNKLENQSHDDDRDADEGVSENTQPLVREASLSQG